ncbi:MAG TPA: hypothetical protein VMZ53_06745 [Kofleriaceae bacterium]|nr:hypothetical protein [Kofleriaceae bacterium]
MKRFAFVLLLAACSSNGSKTSQTSSSTQTGSAAVEPVPGVEAGDSGSAAVTAETARGQKCGENDSCPTGLECVKYYGIAGPKGPQFTSCETKCDGGKACPDGLKCTTIADGPGAVCR